LQLLDLQLVLRLQKRSERAEESHCVRLHDPANLLHQAGNEGLQRSLQQEDLVVVFADLVVADFQKQLEPQNVRFLVGFYVEQVFANDDVLLTDARELGLLELLRVLTEEVVENVDSEVLPLDRLELLQKRQVGGLHDLRYESTEGPSFSLTKL